MTIKLITFKTNQTILGQIDCTDDEKVIIKKPVQVIVQPSKEGPMIGFAPFLEYCEEFNTGIKITMDNVLCITTPSRELVNQYNKVFGSGIQIVNSLSKV